MSKSKAPHTLLDLDPAFSSGKPSGRTRSKSAPVDKLMIEHELQAKGCRYICGVDEVGRGPLAGPVVCAAVIMPLDEGSIIQGIDDSKKLTERRRYILAEQIRSRAVCFRIGIKSPQDIDRLNILEATKLAMKEAIESLPIQPDFVITDGNMTLDISLPQRYVIKGDAGSYTIGAASILAKTYRDDLMTKLSSKYPEYNFAQNKGYPSKEHIQAILDHGLCPEHRRSFTSKWAAD
ncbi:MAG: ribonuclease HII [Clostridia bacterium]|nr:ribonuclease HII [Clostridia bacterium]